MEKERAAIDMSKDEKLKSIPEGTDWMSDMVEVITEAISKHLVIGFKKPYFEAEVLYRFIWKQFGVDPRVLEDMGMPKEKWGWYLRKIEQENKNELF